LAPLVALFVIGTMLQSFLPHFLGTALIALRLVVIPGSIALCMFTLSEGILFAAIVIFFVWCEILLSTSFDKETLQVLLSVLASLPLFKAGVVLGTRESAQPIWRAILFSMLGFNILTIALYANTLLGGSVAADVLAQIQRADEDPFFRFSLGNAIELPAFVAMATVASVVALRGHASSGAWALVANLCTALISQSRMVVLISVYPLLRMWRRFRLAIRVAIVALVVGAVLLEQGELTQMWESLSGRYQGQDYYSAQDRIDIFRTVVSQANLVCLGIGNGIGSSVRMMKTAGMGDRSMESVVLELFYEIGLMRLAAIALLLGYMLYSARRQIKLRIEFLLVVLQSLLLLPVMGYTSLYFFFIGALCVTTHRPDAGQMGRRPAARERRELVIVGRDFSI
jgi:hypothetical protein